MTTLLLKSFKPLTSNLERYKLLTNNIYNSIKDPTDGTSVGLVGDLSNMTSMKYVYKRMMSSQVGREIIKEKPYFRMENVDMNELKTYKTSTFGYHYYKFMSKYHFKPEERPITTYFTDLELGYVLQRYKEIHDFIHVLLGYNISIKEELAVKAFESLQLKIPSASLAVIGGSVSLLAMKDMIEMTQRYIPHIKYIDSRCEFVMNIYYEKELVEDIDFVRRKYGFVSIDEFNI